jgi:hypothetical protein
MSLPAHTYQRIVENAVVTMLTADTTVNQAYKDIREADYSPTFRRSYQGDKEVTPLDVLVHATDLTNAMLGSTGRGAQWRITLGIAVINSLDHDKANDNADMVQGAVERWLAALTPATLNTALGANPAITIHGITGAEMPDTKDESRDALMRWSAVTLHFGAN